LIPLISSSRIIGFHLDEHLVDPTVLLLALCGHFSEPELQVDLGFAIVLPAVAENVTKGRSNLYLDPLNRSAKPPLP